LPHRTSRNICCVLILPRFAGRVPPRVGRGVGQHGARPGPGAPPRNILFGRMFLLGIEGAAVRSILFSIILVIASSAHAQFGGAPSPGAPTTTGPNVPASPPTAPGAPKMTPVPPVANPTLPPGSPGSNIPPRNPLEPLPPVPVQPQPAPITGPPSPGQPSLPAPLSPPGQAGPQQAGAAPAAPLPPAGSFAACMAMWSSGMDMTKRQWAASCRDTMPPRGSTLGGYEAESRRSVGRRRGYQPPARIIWIEPGYCD